MLVGSKYVVRAVIIRTIWICIALLLDFLNINVLDGFSIFDDDTVNIAVGQQFELRFANRTFFDLNLYTFKGWTFHTALSACRLFFDFRFINFWSYEGQKWFLLRCKHALSELDLFDTFLASDRLCWWYHFAIDILDFIQESALPSSIILFLRLLWLRVAGN